MAVLLPTKHKESTLLAGSFRLLKLSNAELSYLVAKGCQYDQTKNTLKIIVVFIKPHCISGLRVFRKR